MTEELQADRTEKASANVQVSSPLTLNNGFQIKNRFFKSAMSEQLGSRDHGPQEGLVNLYRHWARGGVGLMMTGNVMIDSRALGEPRNVVLEDDRYLPAFRRWAQAGHENGAKLWVQLNHPGKQIPAILNPEPVAPSAIPLGQGLEKVFNTPRALTHEEILEIIERFGRSAALAKQAGFSGVQIHGAHGYLVSQFLSERHNQRTDQWGGSAENRRRFVLEVYKSMRAAVGEEFPIGIKLNSADFMKGGFDEEESMAVIKALSEAGINLIEISGGTYESPEMMGSQRESTKRREAFFLDFAEKARKVTDVTFVVTGGFRSGDGMAEALASGATDMIGMARPLVMYPDLPNRILEDPHYKVSVQRPSTGFQWLDLLAALDISWYEQQMHRIAKGKGTKENLGAWSAVFSALMTTGLHTFQKRRA